MEEEVNVGGRKGLKGSWSGLGLGRVPETPLKVH